MLSTELLNAFVESGCSDATFGRRAQFFYADFDREAPSFPDGVLSAIKDLESASSDVIAIRVEPEDLVNASAIAERTGRSRESIRLLIAGQRGPGGFPLPRFYLDDEHPLWTWSTVATWFAEYSGRGPDDDTANAVFLASLNAALEIRRYAPKALGSRERTALKRLVTTGLRP